MFTSEAVGIYISKIFVIMSGTALSMALSLVPSAHRSSCRASGGAAAKLLQMTAVTEAEE